MMSQLLAMAGSLALCAALAAAGHWANQTIENQPDLPVSVRSGDTNKSRIASTEGAPAARPARPDVFYAAVTERPLFAPTRRPITPEPEPEIASPEPAPAPAPQPESPPPKLGLLGVMGNGGDTRALVSNDGGEPVWTQTGTRISGWEITAIGGDWLELRLGNETIRIEMYQ